MRIHLGRSQLCHLLFHGIQIGEIELLHVIERNTDHASLQIIRYTGRHIQKLMDRDPICIGVIRQILIQLILCRNLSLLHKLHDRYSRELLGDRTKFEYRIHTVGNVFLTIRQSKSTLPHDLPVPTDQDRAIEIRVFKIILGLLLVEQLIGCLARRGCGRSRFFRSTFCCTFCRTFRGTLCCTFRGAFCRGLGGCLRRALGRGLTFFRSARLFHAL